MDKSDQNKSSKCKLGGRDGGSFKFSANYSSLDPSVTILSRTTTGRIFMTPISLTADQIGRMPRSYRSIVWGGVLVQPTSRMKEIDR